MFGFYAMDIYYLILVVPALIIAMVAQIKVQNNFSKYSNVKSVSSLTANELTRKILDDNDLSHIRVEATSGSLTDHYDPKANVIRLSEKVYNSSSIAAFGVAAHEAGHAIQRKEEYKPIKLRNTLVPATQFASYMAMPLAILGLAFNSFLLPLGVILFSVVVIFQVVTLPVEFDASRRALATLSEKNYLNEEELSGAKKVLSAAAMTYVASALVSVMNFLRIVLIAGNSRRRR